MKKINKKDIDPKVFSLYDDYAHNRMERREFIEKHAKEVVNLDV